MCLQNVPDYDVEHSEVLLYYIRVLEDHCEFSEALSQLDMSAKERSIVDRTAIAETRGMLLALSHYHPHAFLQRLTDFFDLY
jgi:N-alpha-acetyltransferase 15/16, NatA auxiliary subunit